MESGQDWLLGMFTSRGFDYEKVMLNAYHNAEERLKWMGGEERKYEVRMSICAPELDRSRDMLGINVNVSEVKCVVQADVLVFKDEASWLKYHESGLFIYKEMN